MDEFMDFSQALLALEEGAYVTRRGWNGKHIFIYREPSQCVNYTELPDTLKSAIEFKRSTTPSTSPLAAEIYIGGHINMLAADGTVVVGWLASQTDMTATDWMVIKE